MRLFSNEDYSIYMCIIDLEIILAKCNILCTLALE